MNATRLWAIWQALLAPFAFCFTRPGFRRFAQWLTGLILNVEEHTVTQSLIALELTSHWKALESFVEYGSWDSRAVERMTVEVLQDAPGNTWYGYHVWAGDDTKVHRSGKHVWGTCTFHEYSARCPNRASTVRAHNWVVLGGLLHNPDAPAWFLPTAGRLYFRQSQLPEPGNGPAISFRTKCELMVELARLPAEHLPGKHLAIFDGAYANRSTLRPLVRPEDGRSRRLDILTRLRPDSALYAWPVPVKAAGSPGAPRRWGRRLSPPRQGGRWPGKWQEGTAFIYGRIRQVRWKEVLCQWRVLGWDVVVKAVVAKVEGYSKRFTLVTTALSLSGLQIVELFCARFRQEDGFRDLKQRLGWEECRAWTRLPIERTTQALWVSLTVLRLLQFQLEGAGETDWWLRPPWNPRKTRPSVLDVERLLRRHREGIQRHLADWLESGENAGETEPAALAG